MNAPSPRDSLIRDNTPERPRRYSFVRDEFAAPDADATDGTSTRIVESEPRQAGRSSPFLKYASRTEVLLGAVAVAVLIIGISIWTILSGSGETAPGDADTAVAQADNAAELTKPAGSTPAAPRRTVTSRRGVTETAPAGAATSANTALLSTATDSAAPASAAGAEAPTEAGVSGAATQSAATPPTVSAAAIDDPERIYSNADRDVVPPKMIDVDLPAPPVIAGLPTRTQAVEVVVTEDGSVQQVRLRTAQQRMLDTMLLSRAKMWKFAPAQRQGRPVPYRLVVLWETSD